MRRSYRDRDYSFGQMMLNLRSAIGLTQTGLAEQLGISRFAVGEWEAGNKYPKVEHLKTFIELAVQQDAFPAGREADEIRALWKAARQKVLLDETWLTARLSLHTLGETGIGYELTTPGETRVDWGDALANPNFYGRDWELTLLTTWVVEKRCRVVSTLGLGGIGKSALAVKLMRQVAEHFEVVIWRSLRDAPSCETLVGNLLRVLHPSIIEGKVVSLDQRFSLLLDYLRNHRVLVVLDNLETILEEGEGVGKMRSAYESYEQLLHRIAETEHQSCLLLTSREKPGVLVPLEGMESPVRSLKLTQLDAASCHQLLAEKGVAGAAAERSQLIEVYAGNPLAIKIVAQTIVDIFNGEIVPFLEQGELIFGGVRELLRQQFDRLSTLERCVLLWLAILREPTSLNELSALLVMPMPRARLLEAMEALHRRSLVESGQKAGSFTLQSVVLEYTTAHLIAEVSNEIEQGRLINLVEHGFELAQVPEYVRQIQQRLIIAPVLTHLHAVYRQQFGVEQQLLKLLDRLRTQADDAQGYAPANILALMRELRGHLRSLDLSYLSIRGAYLQNAEMQDTSLARASIYASTFSDTFDALMGIALSRDGTRWAAGSRNGDVRIWEANGQTLNRIWQAHIDLIWSLAFAPDDKQLVTVSFDNMVKVWDVERATLLWAGNQQGVAYCVAFAPAGNIFATSGGPGVILWDVNTGQQVQLLPHSRLVVPIAWSPDGTTIATADVEGTIRLWDINSDNPTDSVRAILGNGLHFNALAFSPDGRTLASGSWDGIVNLWDVDSGSLIETLSGRYERIHRLAWHPDGRHLAIGGHTTEIWLWDTVERDYEGLLHGHSDAVMCVAFTPDGTQLISTGDRTLRVWDIASGHCIRILQGNMTTLFDIDWNPDGTKLISGGTDALLTIYTVGDDAPAQEALRGHRKRIFGVGWSPDGQWVASCSWDSELRLWEATSGQCVQVLQDPDDPATMFYKIGWSPDGQRFVGTRYVSHQGVLVWEISGMYLRSPRNFIAPQPVIIHHVAWSSDSQQLAGGGENGDVYVWDVASATLQHHFTGHRGAVKTLAWSLSGTQLATGARGTSSGEVIIWDVQHEKYIGSLNGHPEMVYSLACGVSENVVISGGDDGALRWWDIQSGECLLVQEAHQGMVQALRRSPDGSKLVSAGADGAVMLWDLQSGDYLQTLRRDRPYERLNITGIRGLTEAQKGTLRALGAVEETGL